MIVKTEAIVLRSRRYRETSKLVTFYSRKFGKLTGVAKGARETRSKFGGVLEPMTYVSLVLYKKEHRDLHLISGGEIVKLFPRLQSNLEKITAGLSVVELVDAAMRNEEPGEIVFCLVVEVLTEIDHATKNLQNVLYYFRLHLLDLMGYKPNFLTCVRCRKILARGVSDERPVYFDAQGGGIVCENCSRMFPKRLRLSLRTIRIFQDFMKVPLSEVSTIEVPEVSKKEIDETLRIYVRYHLAGAERLKSEAVMKRVAV